MLGKIHGLLSPSINTNHVNKKLGKKIESKKKKRFFFTFLGEISFHSTRHISEYNLQTLIFAPLYKIMPLKRGPL